MTLQHTRSATVIAKELLTHIRTYFGICIIKPELVSCCAAREQC